MGGLVTLVSWQTPTLVRSCWMGPLACHWMLCCQGLSIWDNSHMFLGQMRPSRCIANSCNLFQGTSQAVTGCLTSGCIMQGWLLKIPVVFSHPIGVCTGESFGSALQMWMLVWKLPVSCTISWGGPPTGQPGHLQANHDHCEHHQQTVMLWAYSQLSEGENGPQWIHRCRTIFKKWQARTATVQALSSHRHNSTYSF